MFPLFHSSLCWILQEMRVCESSYGETSTLATFLFLFLFAKKVNEGSDNSEIWCVEQLSIAEKKRYRIAFLSEQPFMEQISSQYYIGVARKMIIVYHGSWGSTSGISFPKT